VFKRYALRIKGELWAGELAVTDYVKASSGHLCCVALAGSRPLAAAKHRQWTAMDSSMGPFNLGGLTVSSHK